MLEGNLVILYNFWGVDVFSYNYFLSAIVLAVSGFASKDTFIESVLTVGHCYGYCKDVAVSLS